MDGLCSPSCIFDSFRCKILLSVSCTLHLSQKASRTDLGLKIAHLLGSSASFLPLDGDDALRINTGRRTLICKPSSCSTPQLPITREQSSHFFSHCRVKFSSVKKKNGGLPTHPQTPPAFVCELSFQDEFSKKVAPGELGKRKSLFPMTILTPGGLRPTRASNLALAGLVFREADP